MRVKCLKKSVWAISLTDRLHVKPGDFVDVPEDTATLMIESGYGKKAEGKKQNKKDDPVENKMKDDAEEDK